MGRVKASIIIPVYNAELYLQECLNSIMKQTFHNFEVIAIDDGSSDGSAEILRKARAADSRIRVFRQENRGSAAARNQGIRQAEGDYIAFADADDWVDPAYLLTLVEMIEQEDADIAVCDFYREGKKEGDWQPGIFDKEGIFREFLQQRLFNRIMNKLYRKDLIIDVTFPEGRNYMEDATWTSQVLAKAKKLIRTDKALYYYRIQENSISHSRKKKSSVLCGKFRNTIDRERIILEHLNFKEQDNCDLYAREVFALFDEMFRSNVDLEKFQAFEKSRELAAAAKDRIKERARNQRDLLLLKDILTLEKSTLIQKRHRRRILKSSDLALKSKIAIFYHDMYIIKD